MPAAPSASPPPSSEQQQLFGEKFLRSFMRHVNWLSTYFCLGLRHKARTKPRHESVPTHEFEL
eukprot:scaffold16290_cov54-Phaeocystis_antarctica.AAC.1